jgi:hypothetical protein
VFLSGFLRAEHEGVLGPTSHELLQDLLRLRAEEDHTVQVALGVFVLLRRILPDVLGSIDVAGAKTGQLANAGERSEVDQKASALLSLAK